MKLIWPGEVPSEKTGRNYCFQVKMLTLKEGSRRVLLNQYQHHLKNKTILFGEEFYIALKDLEEIFSPYLKRLDRKTLTNGTETVTFQEDYRKVEYKMDTSEGIIETSTILLQNVPITKNGFFYVPLEEVMRKIFGQYTRRIGKYLQICEKEEDTRIPFEGPGTSPLTQKRLDFLMGKNYGDLYFTTWVDEAQRLNNYRMYIPFSYDGSKPYKLLVVLHGGNGNSDAPFQRSGQKLQYYAEKYGYILLSPNSLVHGGNFGSFIPPLHMFPEKEIDTDHGIPTPDYYTKEEEQEFTVAQHYVEQVLKEVFSNWYIDRDHVFVTGNSMGSCGTFHLLGTYPETFRAGAPTACMPLTEYMDPTPLIGKNILFMIGTEDTNDPAECFRRANKLKESGVNITFQIIGGGYHPTAWVTELETIFQFFEKQ